MRRLPATRCTFLAFLVLACSPAAPGTGDDRDLTDGGNPADETTTADQPDASGPGDIAGDGCPDVPGCSCAGHPVELSLLVAQDGCPGGAGCPCNVKCDCLGGICLETMEGHECARPCGDGQACLTGSTCDFVLTPGGGSMTACLAPYLLCRPCHIDADCVATGCLPGICIDHGPDGRFCGAGCSDTAPCPDGFACQAVATTKGQDLQCLPVGGTCPCTAKYRDQGATTTCWVQNSFGTCTAERTCDVPCAARVPAAESCNLVDDDCNGLTDDAIPATDCDLTNQWGTCKGKGLCAGGQILCQGSYASPEDCLTAADDNCNGTANEKDAPHCTSFFRDVDGDGWGTVESQCWCAPSGEWRAIKPGDCDDGNAAVHPGTTEDCATAFDDDCDGSLDAVDALHCTAWHWDADNDGWGTGATQCRCAASGSWRATKGGDCDDTNAAVFPGGGAVCGKDGGCDGNVLDSGEQCDDGNAVARDGCTACKVSEYRLFPDVVGTVEGTPQAAGKQESCVGNRPHVDAAAFADGSYVVTWTGTTATDTQTAVYLRRVSAAGVAGPLVTVTTPEFGSFNCHGEPSIVGFPDGRFVVVWTSGNDNDSAYTAPAYPPGPDGWGMGIAARLFLADGTPAGAPFVANPWTTGHQFHARAAAIPGGFVLVWTGQGATRAAGIWARRFDSAGAPLGDAMAVNTVAENASPLVAAWADGRFVVYWNVLYGESFPFLRKFRADATPDGSEIVANGNYGNPNFNVTPTSLAAVAGGALVADFDLSSKDIFENWATSVRTVFAADGTAGTPTLVVPTGNSSLNGLSGSLAPLPAGGFAAYWVIDCNHGSRCSTDLAYACVDSLNCTEVVPGGLFTAAGVATGTTFGVGGHGGPIAVFPDGSFLVAWAELVSSSGPSLFVQRYGADGTRVYR